LGGATAGVPTVVGALAARVGWHVWKGAVLCVLVKRRTAS
jgi:hypothetical protein